MQEFLSPCRLCSNMTGIRSKHHRQAGKWPELRTPSAGSVDLASVFQKTRLVDVGNRVQIRVSLVSIEQHLGIALGAEVPSSDVIDRRASRERDNFIVVAKHGRRNRPVGNYRKG